MSWALPFTDVHISSKGSQNPAPPHLSHPGSLQEGPLPSRSTLQDEDLTKTGRVFWPVTGMACQGLVKLKNYYLALAQISLQWHLAS